MRINTRDPSVLTLVVLTGLFALGAAGAAAGAAWIATRPGQTDLDALREEGVITMITQNSQHAYYLDRGEPAGFEYELGVAFAEYLGVELRVVTPPWSEMVPSLVAAQGDFIAASFTDIESRRDDVTFSEPYMIVRQHLIVHASDHGVRHMADMHGMTVHVRAGTSYERRLRELQGGGLEIEVVTHRDRPTEDLIRAVAAREIQATVADTHVARLNRRYYPDVRPALAVSGPQPLAWAVRSDAEELLGAIDRFFRVVKERGVFDRIHDRYYANTAVFDYVDIKVFHERIRTRLPEFETLIKEEARKYGFDWRLIAALAYQESHYHPLSTSVAGAGGFMQLTPATAREMGVRDRYDPAQSIRAGVEYLARMYERFGNAATDRDRLLLAMASYNVGYGHVLDAQAIAREKGLPPGRWSSLEQTLPLLSREEYFRRAPHGYARGTEPVRYINQILTYYDILRQLSPLEEDLGADGDGVDKENATTAGQR
ncbi:MAG: membrane-bound lytic murein transglycosylase MltF [Spirochaetota bacterium]